MARPTAYDRQNSFRLWSAQYPAQPHNGAYLDTEFDALKLSLDETQTNLGLIQDADGAVARGSIGRAQLDSSITLGVAPPALWTTATEYDADTSVVFRNLILYLCLVDHTSGTFSSDLAVGYWQVLADFSATAAIDNGSITTAKLADGAVTNAKLANNAVTTDKMLNSAVTTAKVADGAVTNAKLASHTITTDKVDNSVWGTGDVKLTFRTYAEAGWLLFDDSTIGDASSGATHTGSEYQALFELFFDQILGTYAPLLTSSGGATTRAAQGTGSAAWAAHCRMSLPKVLGRALASAGSGSGLSARQNGETAGAETVALSQANLPNVNFTVDIPAGQGSHTHGLNNAGSVVGGAGAFGFSAGTNAGTVTISEQAQTLPSMSGTAASGGSATGVNKMQPTLFLNVMVKL